MPLTDHVCFGCQRPVGDNEAHIHMPHDEWATSQGLAPVGLDDLLTYVFCEACTERSLGGGWTLERHVIGRECA